jgi:hypothetical protein
VYIILYRRCFRLQKTNASRAPVEFNIDQTTAAAVGGNFLVKLDLFSTSTHHSLTVHIHKRMRLHPYTSHVHMIYKYIIYIYYTVSVVYAQCTRTNCGGHERKSTNTDTKKCVWEREKRWSDKKKTIPLDKFCVHDILCTTLVGVKKKNTYHTV